MADAKKCDRCGAFFEPYIKVAGAKSKRYFKRITIINKDLNGLGDSLTNPSYDLCENCVESLEDWLLPTMCDKCGVQGDCTCDCTREFVPRSEHSKIGPKVSPDELLVQPDAENDNEDDEDSDW